MHSRRSNESHLQAAVTAHIQSSSVVIWIPRSCCLWGFYNLQFLIWAMFPRSEKICWQAANFTKIINSATPKLAHNSPPSAKCVTRLDTGIDAASIIDRRQVTVRKLQSIQVLDNKMPALTDPWRSQTKHSLFARELTVLTRRILVTGDAANANKGQIELDVVCSQSLAVITVAMSAVGVALIIGKHDAWEIILICPDTSSHCVELNASFQHTDAMNKELCLSKLRDREVYMSGAWI
jgi:hypothetical protein